MRTSARFRRVLVVSGALLASASCSLITSLDTLHGAGGDAATTDVATPPVDGSDAEAGPVADSGGFCATQVGVVFCDDFDTPDAVAFSKWTSVVEGLGGSVSLVAADASLPFAAHFHAPAYDAGVPQAALTQTFLTSATTSIRYAFDVRVDHYPTGGTLSFSPIKPSAGGGGQLYFSLNSQSAAFSELITFADGGSYFNGWTLTQRPTPNVWAHVEIDLQGGNPMTASVYLNNQLVMPQNTVIDDRITFGAPIVVAGITYESPSGDVAIVDVDNVVIDFH